MHIAIGLPGRAITGRPDHVLSWAVTADVGPFSSLVIGDRVIAPAHEALTTLAVAAGVTRRIRLMASLVVGPARETTLLARQAATIQVLSGGRLCSTVHSQIIHHAERDVSINCTSGRGCGHSVRDGGLWVLGRLVLQRDVAAVVGRRAGCRSAASGRPLPSSCRPRWISVLICTVTA